MRFKAFLCSACVCLSFGVVASTPNEIFEKYKDKILAGECFAAEGICFGLGKVKSRSSNPTALKMLDDKAQLLAVDNLIARKAISKIDWPQNIVDEERQRLAILVAQNLSVNAKIRGVIYPYVQRGADGVAVAVAMVPESLLCGVKELRYVDVERIINEISRQQDEIDIVPVPVFQLPPYAKGRENEVDF